MGTLKYLGKEFGNDLKKLVKGTGKGLGKVLTKGLGYPILGNLSHNLKSKLENKLGHKLFDSELAIMISVVTNLFAYHTATQFIADSCGADTEHFIGYASLGLFYGFAEAFVRGHMHEKSETEPASLPGKIVSLPGDYLTNLYDRAKERGLEDKIKEG